MAPGRNTTSLVQVMPSPPVDPSPSMDEGTASVTIGRTELENSANSLCCTHGQANPIRMGRGNERHENVDAYLRCMLTPFCCTDFSTKHFVALTSAAFDIIQRIVDAHTRTAANNNKLTCVSFVEHPCADCSSCQTFLVDLLELLSSSWNVL